MRRTARACRRGRTLARADVQARLRVELPRPRDEADPAFIALKRQIRDLIHDEYEIEA